MTNEDTYQINAKLITTIFMISILAIVLYVVFSNYNLSDVKLPEGSVVKGGYQEINMDVSASGYSPNSFVLKKGVPVKWNINVKELTGCNQELILNQYGIDRRLKSGLNVIEFTPDKTGTISFSCGMGMLRGSFIVTDILSGGER